MDMTFKTNWLIKGMLLVTSRKNNNDSGLDEEQGNPKHQKVELKVIIYIFLNSKERAAFITMCGARTIYESSLGNAFLLNTINKPTPVEMAVSATLKIALKKVNGLPPQIGSQLGKSPLQIGK